MPLLDLRAQYRQIESEVRKAIDSVIERQQFIMGPEVLELENVIAKLCETNFAVACASGTDALLLSLKLLDMKPGDEVITTPFTFFATAGAIHNSGGKVVFVDVDPETLLIDVSQVEDAVGRNTRAIVPVHLYGQMAAMDELLRVIGESEIRIVEDAAQAIGARRMIDGQWKMAGSMGTTGVLSFFPSKNLGGWGDGGMVVTQEESLAKRLRKLRTHGGMKRYYHEEVGTNSRLDSIQAAVLKVKVGYLDAWLDARRYNAALYDEMLVNVEGVTICRTDAGNEHSFHQYTIRAERRDDLENFLKEKGIGTGVYFPIPLHLQTCFAYLGYEKGQLPVAEAAAAEVLSLPVYPELSVDDIEYVAECVASFYR
ncbi:MAG: DegT/DnrJ/EryC1/StrS family aminotransferase [Deltaproteobacteria bacterium]|nr:DegT/DnrJ/EryC1/StrS family aminotransferase [Deltaproteobacteria bacterium]MCH9014547.1 DegT/DnrJ/EryC1/StrS family aminotransferase [Gemmatimonadota bacterium]